jgi:hypothetical protein
MSIGMWMVKVSDGNEDSIENWIRGHLCYIVEFCVLRLCGRLFKGDRLLNLVDEILRQSSIHAVTSLLLAAVK